MVVWAFGRWVCERLDVWALGVCTFGRVGVWALVFWCVNFLVMVLLGGMLS